MSCEISGALAEVAEATTKSGHAGAKSSKNAHRGTRASKAGVALRGSSGCRIAIFSSFSLSLVGIVLAGSGGTISGVTIGGSVISGIAVGSNAVIKGAVKVANPTTEAAKSR